jgi:hypothetical protein
MRVVRCGRSALPNREQWIAGAVLVLLVVLRSIVFVFWEQSFFDSDQAITGLMAKHLIESRAFPVFYYGQNYMLGVEAYLAAPVFAVAGVSVTTLKLPLLVLNIGVALLLLRTVEREVGLRPYVALVPVLFFALPSPAAASEMLAPNGGNFAPFVYTLLIWLTRARPGWCGFFFALGFLHREFTLYALVALIGVEAIEGALPTREGLRRRFAMLRTAAVVWLVVQVLKYYSSAAGPGTSTADLWRPRASVLELADRWCGDLASLPAGIVQLFTEHWPVLFGTRPVPFYELSIESTGKQGVDGSWIILAAAVLLPMATIGYRLLRERCWRPEYNFCAYLVLTGLCSTAGYVIGRCGDLHPTILRYELLSTLAVVGLGAWLLKVVPRSWLRTTWIGIAVAVVGISALSHAQLLREYVTNTPGNPKRLIVRHLESRGVKYAKADYWRAYAITFLTNERIIVASDNVQRITEYQKLVDAHRDQAVRLSRENCPGGTMLMYKLWICPL